MKHNTCQVIIRTSFEWSCKTLKCLQVTRLKVEVQGWGFGVGMRKILRKKVMARRWRKSQKPQLLRGAKDGPSARPSGHNAFDLIGFLSFYEHC